MTAHAPYDDLVAGYALGVLDPEDRQTFEAHLATCEACRASLAELDRVATGIGMAVDPVEPPASLKSRTLARATHGSRAASLPGPSISGPPPTRWWQLAAAASLLFAVGIGAVAWSFYRQVGTLRQVVTEQAERLESMRAQLVQAERAATTLTTSVSVLGSRDMIRVDLDAADPTSPAVGRAFVSASRGVLFQSSGLTPLRADRTYQLWLVPAGTNAVPVSMGVFDVDASGASTLTTTVPPGVSVIAAVAVSEEPRGGSAVPTSTPLLAGAPVNN